MPVIRQSYTLWGRSPNLEDRAHLKIHPPTTANAAAMLRPAAQKSSPDAAGVPAAAMYLSDGVVPEPSVGIVLLGVGVVVGRQPRRQQEPLARRITGETPVPPDCGMA